MSLSLICVGVLAGVLLASRSPVVDVDCLVLVGLVTRGQGVLVESMWSVGSG